MSTFFGIISIGDRMKKKILIGSSIIFGVICIGILSFRLYQNYRIANAKIIVNLVDNLEIDVFSEVKLSDLIKSINGKLVKDYKINTTKIGAKKVNFEFINDEDIKVSYSFDINIVDYEAPLIFSSKSYSITEGYDGNLAEELFCGDKYDDNPTCEIVGEYDVNRPGSYAVMFRGIDSSNNISMNEFNLIVKKKSNSSSSGGGSLGKGQNFSDLVNKYKNDNTRIGIDVSHWQGNIDFEKVKNAGVEFVFIRVGSQRGIGGEYYVDSKFEQNIKGFQKVGIPVGIYFYSYANSKSTAKREAKWVIEQIKPYKIDLPVVFDWESWSFFQEFEKSFYSLTEIANTYLNEVENSGYKGMLYSSKYYLENVWFKTKYPVWLAHYTEKTNYQGEYSYWQLCSNGRIDGISGNVDVNVMYLD